MRLPFLIADLHLGHKKIVEFLNEDGTKCRPWTNVDEMNEALIGNWNKVVQSKDKVYLLGDIVFGKSNLHLLDRLNGDKVLIRGNHDIQDTEVYLSYFRDIRASWPIGDAIMTHIPIHPQSLTRWKYNIHGHLHGYKVLGSDKRPDPKYICVSCEQVNYTPISFGEVEKIMKERKVI